MLANFYPALWIIPMHSSQHRNTSLLPQTFVDWDNHGGQRDVIVLLLLRRGEFGSGQWMRWWVRSRVAERFVSHNPTSTQGVPSR